jgi:hypothetical protein
MMMRHELTRRHGSLCALALVFSLGLGAATSAGAAEGAFGMFAGSWRGGGEITGSNGVREHLQCRADYSVSNEGQAMTQTVVCASASYKMDIHSRVEARGEEVQGDWSESTRNVAGQLSGHIAGGRFKGAVQGPNFAAGISLIANEQGQAVNIAPNGGDISNVSIELSRGG